MRLKKIKATIILLISLKDTTLIFLFGHSDLERTYIENIDAAHDLGREY